MSKLSFVGFGGPAVERLRATLNELQSDDPLRPITVITTSNVAGLHLRRRLIQPTGGDGPGLVNVRFSELHAIANRLGLSKLEVKRPLTATISREATREALARIPQYATFANHDSTVQAFERTLREIRSAPVGAGEDIRGTSQALFELYTIYRELCSSFYDREDLLEAATVAAYEDGPVLEDLGLIVLYLPEPGNHRTTAFLKSLAPRLSGIIGLAGGSGDKAVIDWAHELGFVAPPLDIQESGEPQSKCAVLMDPQEEVRYAVRETVRLAREGMQLSRIAILSTTPVPYQPLLEDALLAAEIPVHGRGFRKLRETPGGRALHGFVRLLRGDLRREDVIDWVASAPLQDAEGPIPSADWERIVRNAGITKGTANWIEKLSRIDDADPTSNDARRIIRFIEWLDSELRVSFETWTSTADRLSSLLRDHVDTSSFGDKEGDELRWLLASLEELKELDLLSARPNRQTLALAVQDLLAATTPQTSRYGSGVYRGSLEDATSLDFDHVLILGMVEGSLPPSSASDPVFPDSERGDAMPPRAIGKDLHRRVYDAVRSLAPNVTFCYPRVDRGSARPFLPAIWFLDEATRLHATGKQVYSADLASLRGETWLYYPFSFEAEMRDSAQAPATDQEYNLRSLLFLGNRVADHPLCAQQEFAAGVELQRARSSETFSPFGGNIGGNDWARTAVLSASSLEAFAMCPHRFFYKSVLRVSETEVPEDSDSIFPRDRGDVVHAILKRFVDEGLTDETDMRRVTDEELDRLERSNAIKMGVLWTHQRESIHECMEKFVEADRELRASLGSTPKATEWEFGRKQRMMLRMPGTQFQVSGSIDRLDALESGGFAVIDYKTGDSNKYKNLNEDPFANGEIVQLPLYALIAAQYHDMGPSVTAIYLCWDKQSKKWRPYHLKLSEAQVQEFHENLEIYTASLSEGLFPARPGEMANKNYAHCVYCPFDRCCPSDRSLAWKRNKESPLLLNLNLVANRYSKSPSEAPATEVIKTPERLKSEADPIVVGDDEDVRTSIETDLDATLFVEAGAGTGKTTSLVRRIAGLAASGVAMANIAAITFTRKAAGELLERLRQELETRAKFDDDAFLQIALKEIDSATVGTIDSFARQILAAHPLEAGLPPGFLVLDEVESTLRFDEWWSALLEDLLTDGSLESSWKNAFDLSISTGRLKEFARKLHGRWDAVPSPLTALGPNVDKAVEDSICGLKENGERLLSMKVHGDPRDKLYMSAFESLGELLKTIHCYTEHHQLRDCFESYDPKLNVGSKANWKIPVTEVKDAVRCFRDSVIKLSEILESCNNLESILPLLNRVCSAVQGFAEERQAAGTLEFHDLLVLTKRLLRNNPDIRDRLRRKYCRILVDEFQDTDPLQMEIFAILASSGEPTEGWEETNLEEGRVFFVGDPKQSLYRFRGADIEVYESAKRLLRQDVKFLTKNFRSNEGVLDFVNDTFSELLNKTGQALPVALGCANPTGESSSKVHIVGGPRLRMNASALRTEESRALSNVLRQIVACSSGARGWEVRDRDSRSTRQANWRDVAILIPTRTSLQEIEEELERAKIPYRIDSRSLLYESQQVRELVTLLRAIDDPTDEVAVVASLRSPAFGCSDRDLFNHRACGWNYLSSRSGAEEPTLVDLAMRSLHAYYKLRGEMPVASLLSKIVRERKLMELAVVHRRPRDQWRRIALLQDDAQNFDASEGGTLRRFLDYTDALAENDANVNESVVDEEDDDAVRILTIHASKGLEYPVVILAGLSSEQKPPEAVRIVRKRDGKLEFKLGSNPPVATLEARDLFKAEDKQDELEQDRILYVGATRARDHLVVSLFHKDPQSMASRLYNVIDLTRVEELNATGEPHVEEFASKAQPHGLPPFDLWKYERLSDIHRSTPLPTRAPTQIASEMASEEEDDGDAEEVRDEHRPRGGADLGRAVHTVLQTVNLREPNKGLSKLIQAQAAAESQDVEELNALVEHALNSGPVVKAGLAYHWKEAFLSCYCEGILLEGYVDLIYRRSDGEYVVVDYKTDAVYSELMADLKMEKYRYQAGAYALMMEQTLGRPPVECSFVFLRKGEPNVRHVHDLAKAMNEVRIHLRNVQTQFRSGRD